MMSVFRAVEMKERKAVENLLAMIGLDYLPVDNVHNSK